MRVNWRAFAVVLLRVDCEGQFLRLKATFYENASSGRSRGDSCGIGGQIIHRGGVAAVVVGTTPLA